MSGFSFKVTIAGIPICFSSPQLKLRRGISVYAATSDT